MSAVHSLDRRCLASVLVALSIASLIPLSSAGRTFAAPTGVNFDHIVIIAMENQNYADVLGDGTPSGCPSSTAPFLCGLLPLGSTIPNYHSYCIGSSDPACTGAGTLGNPPCSAACYTAITSGATYTSTDGLGKGSISATNIFDSLSSAGLSWTEFCESNCPRGPDHSPCQQYADTANSPNCITLSGALIGNSQVLGSTSNYVWITPTDSHNMPSHRSSRGIHRLGCWRNSPLLLLLEFRRWSLSHWSERHTRILQHRHLPCNSDCDRLEQLDLDQHPASHGFKLDHNDYLSLYWPHCRWSHQRWSISCKVSFSQSQTSGGAEECRISMLTLQLQILNGIGNSGQEILKIARLPDFLVPRV